MIQITVYALPAPQGSKRFVGHAKNGRGIMIESSKRVRPWREAVKWAALDVMRRDGHYTLPGGEFMTGPIRVEMIFTLPKPKSAPKSRKLADRKPDLSKLVRSTEDALTDAGVWEDDARIVECIAAKVFPGEHALSLPVPGASIRIFSALERGVERT